MGKGFENGNASRAGTRENKKKQNKARATRGFKQPLTPAPPLSSLDNANLSSITPVPSTPHFNNENLSPNIATILDFNTTPRPTPTTLETSTTRSHTKTGPDTNTSTSAPSSARIGLRADQAQAAPPIEESLEGEYVLANLQLLKTHLSRCVCSEPGCSGAIDHSAGREYLCISTEHGLINWF